MNAATRAANPFHGTRRQPPCPIDPEDELTALPRVYLSTWRQATRPRPQSVRPVAPTSPAVIGRLLGIAVASGLRRPNHQSYENDPLYWREFMPEDALVSLIHATGGGFWQVDISLIAVEDEQTIDDVMDAVINMCVDEFTRLNPDIAIPCNDDAIAGSIQQCVVDGWRAGNTLSAVIGRVRDDYRCVRSDVEQAIIERFRSRPGPAA
ncbi:hypothetical protein HLH26_09030 [Gluconacetobacter sp. 1b LMG 1731]|uniref:Uncharacterized protein n=1 Tax=Gluconacetobacter dulcium TaxID=2729096 RepID=A0A7W4NSJ6_9PROT|nr:hypothetical protein [Gluconacetobacter dulcium]MBB2164684.1 hypothetical protein [Gluconacetobacter dulcium]MBB2193820.1 hypothetical protein [Gluconacetobacter dulcium]